LALGRNGGEAPEPTKNKSVQAAFKIGALICPSIDLRLFDLTKEQECPDGVKHGTSLTPESFLRSLIAICPRCLPSRRSQPEKTNRRAPLPLSLQDWNQKVWLTGCYHVQHLVVGRRPEGPPVRVGLNALHEVRRR